NLYCDSRLPLVFQVNGAIYRVAELTALCAALGMLAFYLAYLGWCRRAGYFVSPAKLALFVITFGVMYLCYTPNPVIKRLAPDWTFAVGFAVLGMVHVSQYLAIVWKYNRSLAARPGRARAGWFQALHAAGGWPIAAGYTLFCLAYGGLLIARTEW